MILSLMVNFKQIESELFTPQSWQVFVLRETNVQHSENRISEPGCPEIFEATGSLSTWCPVLCKSTGQRGNLTPSQLWLVAAVLSINSSSVFTKSRRTMETKKMRQCVCQECVPHEPVTMNALAYFQLYGANRIPALKAEYFAVIQMSLFAQNAVYSVNTEPSLVFACEYYLSSRN